MLRISVHDDPECVTFRLEGRLTGSCLQELEHCWTTSLATDARTQTVRFDLTDLIYIDAAGKAFLAEKRAQGAELIACDCLMRAIVCEISS